MYDNILIFTVHCAYICEPVWTLNVDINKTDYKWTLIGDKCIYRYSIGYS